MMDKKKEDTWKDIKGFDGLYQINKFGIVKSIDRNVIRNNHIMSIKGKKLKVQNQFKVSKGYPYYLLSKDGKVYVKKVHRLVAIHFLDNKKNYNIVNHKDGNKENFIFENLEWCSQSHNTIHAYKKGLIIKIKGENNHNTKISDEKIIEMIKEFKQKECSGKTIYELKYKNIITYSHYLDICNGRKRKELFNNVF